MTDRISVNMTFPLSCFSCAVWMSTIRTWKARFPTTMPRRALAVPSKPVE